MTRQQLPDLFLPMEYSSCRWCPAPVLEAWQCDICKTLVWILAVPLTSFSPLLGECWGGGPHLCYRAVIIAIMNPVITFTSENTSSLDDLHSCCQKGRLRRYKGFWRYGCGGNVLLSKGVVILSHLSPTKNRLLAPMAITEEMFWNIASDLLGIFMIVRIFFHIFFFHKFLTTDIIHLPLLF